MTASHSILSRLRALPSWLLFMLALGVGAISALGFEPFNLLPATLIAIAVLILLLLARPEQAGRIGFAFGWGHFTLGLTWIATAFTYQAAMPPLLGWVAVVGLAAFLSIYWALASLAAARLSRGELARLVLALAGLFAIAEMLRGLLFSGFAWNPLGAVWLPLEDVAAFAALVGAPGLSALTVLAAGSLAAVLLRGVRYRLALILLLPLLLVAGLGWQMLRPAIPEADGSLLLIVQPDIGMDEKMAPGGHMASLMKLIADSREALVRHPEAKALIWPEGAIEFPLEEDPDLRRELGRMMGEGRLLLTGGIAVERGPGGEATAVRNSLYALDHRGEILVRYDKAHLVPGGEYLPLRFIAEPLGLGRLVPGTLDFLPGPGPTTWALPGLPQVGPNICYEIIFPGAIVDGGQRPEMILTISNDAWFGRSGPPQHFAQARLRAIEEGLPVVRSTLNGISGAIDGRGNVLARLETGERGSIAIRAPAPLAATAFARLGLLAPTLLGLLLVGLALLVRRKS